MSLRLFTVFLPFKVDVSNMAPVYSLQVDAVASNARNALATAQVLLRAVAPLRCGGPASKVLFDRATVSDPGPRVVGPYAYLITKGLRVTQVACPARIEGDNCQQFEDILKSLKSDVVDAIYLDLAPVQFIASTGLAVLLDQSRRIPLHICRVPTNVNKVLQITGIDKHLRLYADLKQAVEATVTTST